MKKALILASTLLFAVSSLGVTLARAQEDEAADERRAQFEERRQERMAAFQERREERWQAFAEENPALAAELEALREERRTEQEARRAEFAAKYPNIAAAMAEGQRIPGLNQFPGEGFREEGLRRDRQRERPAHAPRGGFRGPGR